MTNQITPQTFLYLNLLFHGFFIPLILMYENSFAYVAKFLSSYKSSVRLSGELWGRWVIRGLNTSHDGTYLWALMFCCKWIAS